MERTCPVCGQALKVGLQEWHLACARCSYEGSTLEPHILEQASGGDLDEALRQEGLAAVRQMNFRRLHAKLLSLRAAQWGHRPTLLDVGCAHGWFLQETSPNFEAIGIEPEVAVAHATRARGGVVRAGFFPDVLAQGERFDVISFNDVLEHIPDINGALAACARHLNSGGILLVNAPSRRGALYRISKILAWLGLADSFGRLWQKGFPSPHVHYLDTDSITSLAQKSGFRLVDRIPLSTVAIRGLYARIRFSREVSIPKALALTVAIGCLNPLLKILPSDIEAWFFERTQN